MSFTYTFTYIANLAVPHSKSLEANLKSLKKEKQGGRLYFEKKLHI